MQRWKSEIERLARGLGTADAFAELLCFHIHADWWVGADLRARVMSGVGINSAAHILKTVRLGIPGASDLIGVGGDLVLLKVFAPSGQPGVQVLGRRHIERRRAGGIKVALLDAAPNVAFGASALG